MKHYGTLISKLAGLIAELENSENSIIIEAEDEQSLTVVSEALVYSAQILRDAAIKLAEEEEDFDTSDIEEIVAIAQEFDDSNDPWLQKQASVLDSILSTICASPENIMAVKKAREEHLSSLREKLREEQRDQAYSIAHEFKDKELKKADVLKSFENSVKNYRPMEAPLSARTCPDHPGAQMARVADAVYQCDLDKKVYDFNAGFTTVKGNKVPGTSVAEQTKVMQNNNNFSGAFSTRQTALNDR